MATGYLGRPTAGWGLMEPARRVAEYSDTGIGFAGHGRDGRVEAAAEN